MNDSHLADSRSQQGELWKILVCNWIGCCEQLFDDPSDESFTVETGVVSFLQGILFFSN